MRFWKSGAAAAALVMAAGVPALADDAPGNTLVPGMQLAQMPPPPMMMTNWTGLYAGLNAGIGFGKSRLQFTSPGVNASVYPNVHGPLGGGTIGYNWQLNPAWVLGVEGDIDGSGINGAVNCPTGPFFNCRAGNSWDGTARLRLGWTPGSGATLLFITGGAAFGEINEVVASNGVNATPGNVRGSSTNVGWTAGAGAEYMLAPAWSLKLEYRYSDLGSFNTRCPAVTCLVNTNINTNLHENAILAGLNFHFGVAPPPPAPVAMPAPPPAAPVVFIVFFDWDKDTITPEGMQIVQQAADAYKGGAPVQIQVTGYTDRSGSAGYNQRLSERRANNVAKALAALGVPPASMVVSGRGENDNRVPTADGVREPQNRRVEIIKP
jgi:opacity protein-like surface antigen